jgi:hypothetical protein
MRPRADEGIEDLGQTSWVRGWREIESVAGLGAMLCLVCVRRAGRIGESWTQPQLTVVGIALQEETTQCFNTRTTTWRGLDSSHLSCLWAKAEGNAHCRLPMPARCICCMPPCLASAHEGEGRGAPPPPPTSLRGHHALAHLPSADIDLVIYQHSCVGNCMLLRPLPSFRKHA